jgi:DHA2 family multidrug resistance protein
LFVPLTTASLAGIPNAKMSNATGLYTLVRQLGGSLGIAILALVQTRREDFAQQSFAAGVTLGNPMVGAMLRGTADRARALGALSGMVQQNATVVSYDYVFRICAIVFAFSIPTVMLLARPKRTVGAPPPAAME